MNLRFQHGYIEDDVDGTHGGSRRERWWRAAHRSTVFGGDESGHDDAARDAVGTFLQAVAVPTPARARALLEAMRTHVDGTEEASEDTSPVAVQVAMSPRPGRVVIDEAAADVVDPSPGSRDP